MAENLKIVAIFSGGMDSTLLVHELAQKGAGWDVKAISFNYGQKHGKELLYAKATCEKLGIEHEIIDLSCLRPLLKSALTDNTAPVPEGHYESESMKATVVPNRNMIMLSIAAGHAISIGARYIAYAAHKGDHAIYPDCRVDFMDAIANTLGVIDWEPVHLVAPYAELSKTDIAERYDDLEISPRDSWSCYKGGDRHCGKCGTCVERIEAFRDAGVEDTTDYEL